MWNRNEAPTPFRLMLALSTLVIGASGPAQAGRILLADNSQVLQSWQQSSGTSSAPRLVEQPDGATTLQWQGAITLDVYGNASRGTSTATPLRDGTFHRLQAQGDLRSTAADGSLTYLQFSASHSSDASVISHATGMQVNGLQMGRAGEGYLLSFGDVAASFSTLGTNVGLRGMLGQRLIGQSVLSVSAGVLAESWESLTGAVDRTKHLRNVLAAKLETPVSESLRAYATIQGYSDQEDEVTGGSVTLAPASGRAVTAGFAFQEGVFALQGEAGASRWQEDGQSGHNDQAVLLDAGWTFETVALRAGYHDIGKYYSSLSAQGGNGVREAYLNGNWAAAPWLNLSADLRHSENALAVAPVPPATANATETDSAALNAAITFEDVPGLNLMLSRTVSDGKNSDDTGNRNDGYGASLSYAASDWNASLGYNRLRVENAAATATNGRVATWSLGLGRRWGDEVRSLGVNLAASLQEQELDTGPGPRTMTWQLGLSSQHARWGALMASYVNGDTEQSGGDHVAQRGWQLEASHPFSGGNAVKFYYRDNEVSGSTSGANRDERTTGLQLVYML